MFEMLVNLMPYMPKWERPQLNQVHAAAQEILTMCSSIEDARKKEGQAYQDAVRQAAGADKH